MHSLYLNTKPSSELLSFLKENLKNSELVSSPNEILNFHIIYDLREWECDPIIDNGESLLGVAGWFILDGEKNNLNSFLTLIEKMGVHEALRHIEHGVFTAFYYCKLSDMFQVFTDPMGISSSYYRISDSQLIVTPSASSVTESINSFNANILKKFGYIPGEGCLDKDVKRLTTGAVIDSKGNLKKEEVVLSNKNNGKVDSFKDVLRYMGYLARFWDRKSKHVPLSSGFDSRLIAIVGDAGSSYTWGPKKSFDIKAGEKIAHYLNLSHKGFSFICPEIVEAKYLYEHLVSGAGRTNRQLINAYAKAYSYSYKSGAYVCLDGYLGDVLQRGTFLFGKGIKSEVIKFFPSLCAKQSEYSLLRSRFKKATTTEFGFIKEDYEKKVKHIGLDPLKKVAYYECFYGRGNKHAVFGGNTINAVFNVIVPLMYNPPVYNFFFGLDVGDIAKEKAFKALWSNVSDVEYKKIKRLRSENFINCYTPTLIMGKQKFFGRLINNYVPLYFNYTKEHKNNG